jgi:hypothetical protein
MRLRVIMVCSPVSGRRMTARCPALPYFARASKTPLATVMAENAFGQPA